MTFGQLFEVFRNQSEITEVTNKQTRLLASLPEALHCSQQEKIHLWCKIFQHPLSRILRTLDSHTRPLGDKVGQHKTRQTYQQLKCISIESPC